MPFTLVALLTFANTADDPLITLRYAWNLLHHGQPVFNLGERVEGYTSPIHLFLATAILLLPGGAALLKLKIASLLFGVAALWQTTLLAERACLPRNMRFASVIAVAGSWNFVFSASNGLETSLVAFLATGAAASLANRDPSHPWWRPAVWTGLLAVSRPDAILIVVALAGVHLAAKGLGPPWRRLAWLSGPAITLVALLTFRIAYYGQLVPNTYFAKHLALLHAVGSGIGYLIVSQPLSALGHGGAVVLAGGAVLGLQAWLILVGLRQFLRMRPAVAYACAIVVAQLALVLESGGDWMKGGRFFAPAIPAATVLVFLGVESLLIRAGRKRPVSWLRRDLAIATLALVLLAPVNGGYIAPASRLGRGISDSNIIFVGNPAWGPLWAKSAEFAKCLRPGETVAYSEVGLLGYGHPDLRIIDTRGLTSRDVAVAAPPQDKGLPGVTDPHWFLATSPVGRVLARRRPEMIISFDQSGSTRPGGRILNNLYSRLASVPEPTAKKTLLVYVRGNVSCALSR